MRKLKLFLSLLMLFTFSVGNVWADAETIASGTFNGKNETYTTGWSTTGTGKGRTDCIIIGKGENVTSPSVDLSQYESITISIKARRYGSISGSKATIAVAFAGVELGTVDATSTTATTSLTDIEYTVVEATAKTGTFVFTCTNATSAGSSHGAGINSITITGVKKAAEPVLSSITVATAPTTLTYTEGETFDPTGLVINANYDNSTSTAVDYAAHSSEFSFTPSLTTALATTDTKVTITWGEQSVDQTIIVNAAGGCTNTVAVTKGTETNGTYTFSATEVCGDGDGGTVFITNITPAEGYELDDITATVGTVDKENNKVTGITANTTITVTFKELPKYTVSFNVGGSAASQADITETSYGAGITLPAGPTPTCSADGWTFAGWATAAVAEQTTTAPTLLAAGANYKPSADCTLFAVYKKSGEETEIADVITSANLAATGTSYTAFEYKSTTSNVTYHGASAKTAANSRIQVNTTAPRGIMVKANPDGLKLKSVAVTFSTTGGNETTSNGRSFDIYGKEGNFTDLSSWDNIKSGATKIGTITYQTGTASYTQSCATPYNYTGFATVTLGGAQYYESLTFTWVSGTVVYYSSPNCCTKHSITIADNIEHGSVEADLAQACEGTEVTLTATPNDHCRFVEWNVTAGGNAVEVNNQNKFSMPDADVTVSATFEEIKNAVTVADNIVGGSVEVTGAEDLTSVLEGTALTVTATADAENHYIGGVITVKDGENNDVTASVLDGSTLTMPDYAITISATFTPTYAINIVADGGSIALTYDKNGAADGYALAGTTISAEATADDAHTFTSLEIEGVENPTIVDNEAEFTMPAGDVTITATFAAKTTPTINVDAEVLEFDPVDYKGELAAKTFHVSGVALAAGKLSITCDNAAFAVSPAEIDVDGTLAETEISVTPVTTTCGKFDGTITVSGGNATAKEILVSLTVNKLAANLSWSASEATVTIDANDNVFPTLVNPRGLENIVYSSLYETVATINASTGAIELVGPGETYIIANFAGNDTVAALAEDALYYTLTVQKKYSAKYFINGQEQKAAEQTALAGTELVFPTDFSSFTDCSELTFVGWAEAAIEGKQAEAPTFVTDFTMPSDDVNFYAVFAEEGVSEGSMTTIQYTGTTTTSLADGENEADVFGLDESEWSVISHKNSANTVGLNKEGTIRLYYNTNGSTTLEIEAPQTIDSVKINFKESNKDGFVEVAGETVTAINGAYPIGASSFIIGNAGTAQVHIYSINVIFNGSSSFTNYRTTCPSCATVTLSAASVEHGSITLSKESVKTCEAAEVTVTATPDPGYKLDDIELSGVAGATYSEGVISIPQDAEGTLTVTASFAQVAYTVTLEQTGGANAELSATPEVKHFGDEITISAPEVEGFVFTKWTTSDAELVNAYASATSFTMPAKNVTVSANYARLYTVAALMESEEDISNVAVRGYVTSIKEAYSTTHHNISYYISDNGKEDVRLQSYRGVGEDAENITVGDKVLVTGNFTTSYNGELTAGNTLLSRVALASITIDASEAATVYEAGDAFELDKVKAIATYGEATVDITAWATWTPTEAPIITEAGNVELSATWCGQSDNETVAVTLKPEAPISWSATEAEVTYGATPDALPSLTNAQTLAVTYSSDNTDVATISNEEGHEGKITIKAIGTTNISAIFAGNETYKATTVSYELTVTCATLPALDAVSVTNITCDGATFNWDYDAIANADGYYLEVALYDDPTDIKAQGGLEKGELPYGVYNLEAGTRYVYKVRAFSNDEVNYCNDGWGETYEGDFTTAPYYITGSFNEWAMTPMTADSFVFENLAVGTYEIKVSIDGTFADGKVKGFADLTPDEMVAGLYSGTNDNIVFTLAKAGKVVVTYNQREFKVVGEFEAQSVELAGNWDWDSHVPAEISDDRKSATAKKTFNKDEWVTFKMVVDGKWMGTSGDEDYKLTRDDNSVSGLLADGKNQYFQADKTGEYEFTWTFGTNAVTVKFPDHTYTVAWSLAAGPDETLGELERQLDFEGDPTDDYTLTMLKDVLQIGTFNVKVFEDDATTPIATTTLNIAKVGKYYLEFDFHYNGNESTVTASAAYDGEPTGVDETGDGQKAVKMMKDNTIYIIRGDKTYTITGQVVK